VTEWELDELELEDAGQTFDSSPVFNVSDMEIDEISFVSRGANQKARVAFWKSDDGEPDPREVAIGYTVSRYGVSLAQAEAAVDQHFGKQLDLETVGIERQREWLGHGKATQNRRAVYRTASSRALAEELAAKEREVNPSLTPAQALARVYELHPGLYQDELTVSDLMMHRQTQSNAEARRFA
jgi:hypothetical protein